MLESDLSAKCFETQIGVSVTLSIAIGAPYSDYIKSLYVDHGEKYNIPYDETKIIEGREKVIELLRSRLTENKNRINFQGIQK